jgi:hypothetical protein
VHRSDGCFGDPHARLLLDETLGLKYRQRSLPPAAPSPPLSLTMPTPAFTVPAAYIVALPVQCVFFGLALATFILCVRALCAIPIKDFTRTRWALLAVSIATIIVGAISIGQAIAHNLFAFVYYKDGLAAFEALNINHYPAVWIHVRRHQPVPRRKQGLHTLHSQSHTPSKDFLATAYWFIAHLL